jgi:sterol desaturase/sphingolipid hydroxylase (fatty acid hydroxylase superfamily)
LSRNVIVFVALITWFALLAIAEFLAARKRGPSCNGSDSRLVTNFGLAAIGLVASSLLPLANLSSAAFSERLGIGISRHVAVPWVAMFALTAIAQTFAAYWVHRAMHQTSLLWRVHRVHHADSAVDVSTSLRNHPFELLLTVPVSALVVLLLGAPVSVVVAFQTLIVAAAIWQHADIDLPLRLDRMLAVAIVTPRLHRLHHNPERPVHDSNFGELVTVWDRLFGTLNLSEARGRVGLDHQAARPDNLLEQIWSPVHTA